MVSIYILGSFIIFMLLKMPIPLSMAISSFIGLLIAGVPLTAIPQWMAHGVHSYPLMAIPFFIFAGGLLNVTGSDESYLQLCQCLRLEVTRWPRAGVCYFSDDLFRNFRFHGGG